MDLCPTRAAFKEALDQAYSLNHTDKLADQLYRIRNLAKQIKLSDGSEEVDYRHFVFANFSHTPRPSDYAFALASCLGMEFEMHGLSFHIVEDAEKVTVRCMLSVEDQAIFAMKPGLGLTRIVDFLRKLGLDPHLVFQLVPEDCEAC
jgi:hypothetical protein